ncbi:hypothetical protein JCM15519_06950 [Fundidesulfovibrio butyratiphilus]
MALTVETGAGVSGANTLADVARADAYFLARGLTTWAGEAAAKEAALARAMDWLNGLSWKGCPVTYNQPLCWPRYEVPIETGCSRSYYQDGFAMGSGLTGSWPSGEIPAQVLDAQCEAALRYLTGTDMMPDLNRGGRVVMQRVDVITTQYEAGAPAGKTYPAIMALLRPFLHSSAGARMVRG